MSGVAVTGIGMHPFGRFPNSTVADLGAMAVRAALADAGCWGAHHPIDAVYCGTAYGGVATGHRALGQLALTGPPIIDVEAGCASGAAALQLGAASIAAGQHRRVLVLGVEKMPKGVIRSSFFAPWQEASGLTPAPATFALRAQRTLREHGLDVGHLAALVVKNRAAGVANPDAMFRSEVTAEGVLASRMVCDPLRLWMLCSPNEGAAAVVLESASGAPGEVRVAAVELRSHLPGSVLGEDAPLSGLDDSDIVPPSTRAAQAAYERAGVGPGDLDVVECQDTDAARELLVWHELGLCDLGDQPRLLRTGDDGRPSGCWINPSGGLLSKGEPLGASALGQVIELVRQLRGDAADRQLDGARIGLSHVIGRGANACVSILVR